MKTWKRCPTSGHNDSNKEKEPKQKLFIFTAFRLAIEKVTKMLNYYENIWSPILSG